MMSKNNPTRILPSGVLNIKNKNIFKMAYIFSSYHVLRLYIIEN